LTKDQLETTKQTIEDLKQESANKNKEQADLKAQLEKDYEKRQDLADKAKEMVEKTQIVEEEYRQWISTKA